MQRVKVSYYNWPTFEADVQSVHNEAARYGGTQVQINRDNIPNEKVIINGDEKLMKDWLPFLLFVPKEAQFIA